MRWHSLALAACWGWVLVGQSARTASAAGAEPAAVAPQMAAEPDVTAQPLEPIPAEPSQPAHTFAPVPAGGGQSAPILAPLTARESPPAPALVPISAEQDATQPPTSDRQPPTSSLPELEASLRSGPGQPASAASAPRDVTSDAAELVARALSLPADGTLGGRPTRLQDLLAQTLDQQQREELIAAYWHLAEAVAEYNFCRDYQAQVERWQARMQPAAVSPASAAQWKVAAAMAHARCAAAEAALVEQQHVVATLARLGPTEPLPLPADHPYAGPYRTYFRELFPGGIGPGRTRLIDQTLPLDQQAIEHYAAAVAAAEQAVAAAGQPAGAEATTPADALQLIERRYRQQGILMQAVVAYNRQIAEYVLAIAPPGIDAAKLVSMLIKSPPAVAQPSPPAESSTVRPAVAEEQLRTPGRPTRAVLPPDQPTPAVLPSGSSLSEEELPGQPGETLPPGQGLPVPRNLPSGEGLPTGQGSWQSEGLPRGEVLPEANDPPAGHHPGAGPAQPMLPLRPVVPVKPPAEPEESTIGWPGLQRSEVPGSGRSEAGSRSSEVASSLTSWPAVEPGALTSPALYGALGQAAPEQQAEQLAALLNWDRLLAGKGQPMDLISALKAAPPGERRPVVESYWQVRRRAAEYQLLTESLPWFDELGLVLQARGVSAEPAVLRQARHHAAGAARAAEARLLKAQYELAVRLGQTNDWPWPLPSTVPHAGAYSLQLEGLPPELAGSWSVRRLTESIARLHRRLAQQAAAVVAADQARSAAAAVCSLSPDWLLAPGRGELGAAVEGRSGAARPPATRQYFSGTGSLLAAVEAMEMQVQATEEFLAALTDYNAAIARYAFMTLPPQTPAERALGALVAGL